MSKVTREYLPGLELANEKTGFSIPVLAELIAQASAAPEQDPVARFIIPGPSYNGPASFRQARTYEEFPKESVEESKGYWLEGEPLYKHADDDELERLRADIEAAKEEGKYWHSKMRLAEVKEEKANAKLAEVQALLRGLLTDDIAPRVAAQIEAFLSSTAQPAESLNVTLVWAVGRWKSEVKNRPLINAHRRSLDDTWRQVIRHCGGDPDSLCGPSHDTLLSTFGQPADGVKSDE